MTSGRAADRAGARARLGQLTTSETVADARGRLIRAVTGLTREVGRLLAGLLIALIHLYQRVISPCLRPCCRFVPSCSVYAAESLRKHGLVKGVAKAAWRLARCQPFARGGLDEP